MAELIMAGIATPATPSSGKATIFIDTSNNLAKIDPSGNVMKLSCPGSFTLTIPATGTAALLGTAQTFTALCTFAPPSSTGLQIDMPSGTANAALLIRYITTNAANITASATSTVQTLNSRDFGNDTAGCNILIGRNTNSGSTGGASGTLRFVRADSGSRWIWPDNSGDLRIHTAAPTGSAGAPTVSDTAGTVVGTQTSWYLEKEAIKEHYTRKDLLDAVMGVRLFDYKLLHDSQRRCDDSQQSYTGLVIMEDDRRQNAWFANNLGRHQTPVLNERNLFGYLIGAIQAQQAEIESFKRLLQEMLTLSRPTHSRQ
jgi:hypothetical protein